MKTYTEVIDYLNENKRQKHLLIGNGFSISYDNKIFSYNALHNFVMGNNDKITNDIFQILNTQNFELVMEQLDNFYNISKILGATQEFISKIETVSSELKSQLINSITELHPEHVFNIPEEKSKSCAKFLSEYIENDGNIFSSNYDLLLYWVLMQNDIKKCIDGFGRDAENLNDDKYINEDDIELSELRWGRNKAHQNIYYLHGALHIFDEGIEIIKEEYDNSQPILGKIKTQIDKNHYPIFVTAGDGNQKLNQIMHNKYLSFCYDKLCQIEGSLVVFGFNFGEYDKHIIQAINIAAKQGKRTGEKLHSIYIGIFSDRDNEHIQSLIDKKAFKCKVNLFDAKTVNIW